MKLPRRTMSTRRSIRRTRRAETNTRRMTRGTISGLGGWGENNTFFFNIVPTTVFNIM